MQHHRRGHAEGHEVGQRVQLTAEGPADAGAPGHVAVYRVQRDGDRHGDQRGSEPAVGSEHEGGETRDEAARGEQIRQVEVRPHAGEPAVG